MYICMCNPFTDRTVDKFLNLMRERKVTIAETYRACSGGESPQCCSCLCTLKDIVQEHNSAVITTPRHLPEIEFVVESRGKETA